MMTRCSGLAAVLVMAGTLTLSGTTVAAASSPDKLDASLVYVLEHATPDEMISAILYCTAQTDLDVLGSELTAARARRGTRHRAVVSTLRDTAHASQAPLLAELLVLVTRLGEPFGRRSRALLEIELAGAEPLVQRCNRCVRCHPKLAVQDLCVPVVAA